MVIASGLGPLECGHLMVEMGDKLKEIKTTGASCNHADTQLLFSIIIYLPIEQER